MIGDEQPHPVNAYPGTSSCFNPCCRGPASRTFWPVSGCIGDTEVSILVVVDLPLELPLNYVPRIVERMFQSLLSWTCLSNRFGVPPFSVLDARVSILV